MLNTTLNLKQALERVDAAVNSAEACFGGGAESGQTLELLMTHFGTDELATLVQLGSTVDRSAALEQEPAPEEPEPEEPKLVDAFDSAVVSRCEEAKSMLTKKVTAAAEAVRVWTDVLREPERARLGDLAQKLASSSGASDDGANRGPVQTLVSLLECRLGGCLETVVAMSPDILGAVLDLSRAAATSESLSREQVAALPADAATATVLAALLANTPVRTVGDVPLKALGDNAMEELNLLEKALSPCEAGLVAHHLGDPGNGLNTVVVNRQLTLSEAMCHDERLELAGKGIGQAEEVLIEAVLRLKAAVTGVRCLDISDNPISVDGAAGIGKAVAGTQIETIVFGPKSTKLECGEKSWDLSGQGLAAAEVALMLGASAITELSELNLSANPSIGPLTGYRDKRDPLRAIPVVLETSTVDVYGRRMEQPGVYPKGSFVHGEQMTHMDARGKHAVAGSRWGVVDYESRDSVNVFWLDDGSEARGVQGITMAIADRGLIGHIEPVYGAIEALCDGLPATSIERLDLSGTGLRPAGLAEIATVFASESPFTAAVKELNLTNNPAVNAIHDKTYNGVDLRGQLAKDIEAAWAAAKQVTVSGAAGPTAADIKVEQVEREVAVQLADPDCTCSTTPWSCTVHFC